MKNITYTIKKKVLKGPAKVTPEYQAFVNKYNKGRVVKEVIEVEEKRTLKTYKVIRDKEYYRVNNSINKAIANLQAHFQGRTSNLKIEDYRLPKVGTIKGNEILIEITVEVRDNKEVLIETWTNKTKYKKAFSV